VLIKIQSHGSRWAEAGKRVVEREKRKNFFQRKKKRRPFDFEPLEVYKKQDPVLAREYERYRDCKKSTINH